MAGAEAQMLDVVDRSAEQRCDDAASLAVTGDQAEVAQQGGQPRLPCARDQFNRIPQYG